MLEQTFGARMEVLEHLGMPVVVDDYHRQAAAGSVMSVDVALLDVPDHTSALRVLRQGARRGRRSPVHCCGFIGVYITLRGMSYIGHGLSHAIFGGFAAASLVSASFIYLGAGIWGLASALSINWVTRKHRIGADAAIGVITTASFALGVALLSKFGSTGPSFDNAAVRIDLWDQLRPDRDARRRHRRHGGVRRAALPVAAVHDLRS